MAMGGGPSGSGAVAGLWGWAPSKSRGNAGARGKATELEPAAAISWARHPGLSNRGEGPQAVSVMAVSAMVLSAMVLSAMVLSAMAVSAMVVSAMVVKAAALLLSWILGVAPTA